MTQQNPPIPPETDNQPTSQPQSGPQSDKVEGEGSYEATKDYDEDVSDFLKRRGGEVEKLAKDAEAALDGPEGEDLRAAEQEARDRAKG
ncbi:MAG: hypothetical protein ABJA20_01950 [Novosphingobium sp.]